MDYTLAKATPGRAELVRSRTGQYLFAAGLLVVGLPAVAIGAFLALGDPFMGAAAAGFGLAFSGGGILVATRSGGPAAFVFSDADGALLAYRTAAMTAAADGRLPYGEIAAIRQGLRVSGGGSENTTTVHHTLDVVKKDGVAWTLFYSQNESRASDVVNRVKEAVDLSSSSPNASEAPTAAEMFDVQRGGAATTIRWKKRQRIISQLGFLAVAAGLTLAVQGFQFYMPAIAYYAVTGFLSIFDAVILFGIVDSVGKKGVVRITTDRFRADEEGGFVKHWFEEPLENVRAVCFGYRPNEDDRTLLVLNPRQAEALSSINEGEGDVSSAISAAMTLFSARRIDLGESTLAEKLALEQLIQDEIERVSGRKVL